MSTITDTNKIVWCLSAQSADVASLGNISLLQNPFRIGRSSKMDLTLKQPFISCEHASIWERDHQLYIADSGSRNGTFVNGDRIERPARLSEGDLIQFSHCVFRLSRSLIANESFGATLNSKALDDAQLIIEFEDLMTNQLVNSHFQPIVNLHDGKIVGFESLARGVPRNLHSPKELFRAAEKMQRQGELSEMLRAIAAENFQSNIHHLDTVSKRLFLNTHPFEIDNAKDLIVSLELLRLTHSDLELVLEIHEASVTNMDEMHFLSQELKKLGIEIAYDDFGAGQARFFELIEEPPSFLKFDIRLVKDLHKASIRRVQAIEQLVIMVKNLGITCIAEGIEVEQDAEVCRQLGFTLAQGFHYSKPQPISFWNGSQQSIVI